LDWTQYKLLIRIENEDKREFYIAESVKNNGTSRQLERQINSQLFERLLLSNDVKNVMAVARNEKLPSEAGEIIKDPMILEFLGLKRESSYYERDFEQAIITNLQDFLLELGNGFSFVARQKPFGCEIYASQNTTQISASQYELLLPTDEQLLEELDKTLKTLE
jgi:predicted nuclease of restriction endonuclease-like (RecB) superfamily